jgi:hypothetical protein
VESSDGGVEDNDVNEDVNDNGNLANMENMDDNMDDDLDSDSKLELTCGQEAWPSKKEKSNTSDSSLKGRLSMVPT